MSITGLIKKMQNIMRQDVGVDGDAQRISQIVWMIFLKIFDDKELELELMEEDYQSPIPEKLRWRNWAADDEGMTGDELLDFINDDLFPGLKNLETTETHSRANMVRALFADSFNYMKSGTLIRQVVNQINGIDFNSSEDRHLFNEFYESFLKDLQSAGNSGEYYTPRAVTQFAVDMVNPRLGEEVLDPACGTGGFLSSAIERLHQQASTIDDYQDVQQKVLGIEKKPLPHMLAMTNLILHGIEIPEINHDNSLAQPLRNYTQKDRVDVIVTNPPFGGTEEDGIETNFPAGFQTKETADLFMMLIMELLKENGRGAIVLPDGFLFADEGIKVRIKEKLLSEFNLHTIVRLPHNVFSPYTNIRTNVLFFEKGKPTEDVWYFEHPYPEGQKSYSKTKPIRIEEFDREKAWWNNREENEYAWKVSAEEIKDRNYNLDIKNPYVPEEERLDPQEALYRYHEASAQVKETKQKLADELSAILQEMF